MDPTLAAVISMVGAAVASAILRWAAYRWPLGYHRRDAVPDAPGTGSTNETQGGQ